MEDCKNNGAIVQLESEHEPSKLGVAGSSPASVKTYKCKYCSEEFQNVGVYRNHLRWQHIKPETNYSNHKGSPRKGIKQNHTMIFAKCPFCGEEKEWKKDAYTRHIKMFCKANPDYKPYKGHPCSNEVRERISEKQRNNSYRRIMRHTQEYNGTLYDSSWEVDFAKRLDSLGVSYERPKIPIPYIGVDGLQHNYFPDFWIPEIQKFVEIKNSYLFENDPKVKILRQRDDIIWLTSLQQINEFYIAG